MEIMKFLRINIIILSILFVITGTSMGFFIKSLQDQEKAITNELELKELAADYVNFTYNQSDLIKNYTQSGIDLYLDSYLANKKNSNLFDTIIQKSEEVGVPLQIIGSFKIVQQTVQSLEEIEEQAIKAVQENKKNYAQSLVFTDWYRNKMSAFKENVDEFEQKLSDWISEKTTAAKNGLRTSMIFFVTAVFIISITAILLPLLFLRKLKPLKVLTDVASKVKDGDFTQEVPVISTKDEIGQLSETFRSMLSNLKSIILQIGTSSEKVMSASSELLSNAEQSAATAEQVTTIIEQVSRRAEKQNSALEHNLINIHDVTNIIQNTEKETDEINRMAKVAVQKAGEGSVSVQNTAHQIRSVNESVLKAKEQIHSLMLEMEKVTQITSVISSITEQTNLLALNAAIEAARAGEYGKGFAVVADEIRKLAEESQASTKRIEDIIEKIQNETRQSVEYMSQVSEDVEKSIINTNDSEEKFENIRQSITALVPSMEEMVKNTKTASILLHKITENEVELVSVAQENAATAEEVSASSEEQLATMEEITSSAEQLAKMAEDLQSLVQQFKVS